MKTIDEIITKIYRVHEKYHIYPDVYKGIDGETIYVEIDKGDWKHEHAASEWIMESIGAHQIDELITWDNGSDCYSAVRRYEFRHYTANNEKILHGVIRKGNAKKVA